MHKATKIGSPGEFIAKVYRKDKLLAHGYPKDWRAQHLVTNEVAILRKLGVMHTPYFVAFRKKYKTENSYYLVFEMCDGGDLESFLKENRLSEKEAFKHFKQLLEGFKILQKKKIMHRDFKPNNVFIHKGNFIIGDFGLSKPFISEEQSLQNPNGHKMIAAPEMIWGKRIPETQIYVQEQQQSISRQYGLDFDIFSLGVTFYYMLYAKWPLGWGNEDDPQFFKNKETYLGKNLLFHNDVAISDTTRDLLRQMIDFKEHRITWKNLFERTDQLYEEFHKSNSEQMMLENLPQDVNPSN